MAESATIPILPVSQHGSKKTLALQETILPWQLNQEDLGLTERVERALRATGYGALRAIHVFVQARIVRLIGEVPNFYLKQVAQTTVLAVPGTHGIQNGLEVVRPIDPRRRTT